MSAPLLPNDSHDNQKRANGPLPSDGAAAPTAGTLIGEIFVTPANPRPAQSVHVEVRSPNGTA